MSRRRWSARRHYRFRRTIAGLLALYAVACILTTANPPMSQFEQQATDPVLVGSSSQRTRASYTNRRPTYCYDRHPGRRTTRKRVPNVNAWTAHKTLPCGTWLHVRRGPTNRSVMVQVWDRGPYVQGRDLDLSRWAFSQLDDTRHGVVVVWWRRV